MFNLEGHTALVTGGNSGIGLGMARGLAKAGAAVAVWGRTAEKNAAAADELRSLGVRAEGFACDVTDEEQVVETMKATVDAFGRVDSCFANAGGGKATRFAEMSLADWHAVADLNMVATFLTFREAVRHMLERDGGGVLVAVASVGSIHGMPKQEPYASSKAGVCALTRSLAVEYGRKGIRANAVLPGWIATDLTAAAREWKSLNDAVLHRTPAGRWGEPADFEGVAVYLASDASRFHTGDTLCLDGGYTVF